MSRVHVTYLQHSGFLVETEHSCLLFDYWKGAIPDLDFHKDLYIFSSHAHHDHYCREIFKLENACQNVSYILSSDIRESSRDWKKADNVTFLNVHEHGSVGECEIDTLYSTDEGVAYLVNIDGVRIYHAGDLHWWDWPGEPQDENEEMGRLYRQEIDSIQNRELDLAFVVLDPRQEESGTLGMDYFLRHVKARYVFPMHCWEDYKLIADYKKENDRKYPMTKIVGISEAGQCFEMEVQTPEHGSSQLNNSACYGKLTV